MTYSKHLRKLFLIMLLLFVITMSCSCSDNISDDNTTTEESSNREVTDVAGVVIKEDEVSEQVIETHLELEECEGNIYIHPQLEFKIAIPESWDGKYIINEGELGIGVYHKNEHDVHAILFDIGRYGTVEQWETDIVANDLEDVIPDIKIGELDGFVYTAGGPSDYPYDPSSDEKIASDEYSEMVRDVDGILKSFSSANE